MYTFRMNGRSLVVVAVLVLVACCAGWYLRGVGGSAALGFLPEKLQFKSVQFSSSGPCYTGRSGVTICTARVMWLDGKNVVVQYYGGKTGSLFLEMPEKESWGAPWPSTAGRSRFDTLKRDLTKLFNAKSIPPTSVGNSLTTQFHLPGVSSEEFLRGMAEFAAQ